MTRTKMTSLTMRWVTMTWVTMTSHTLATTRGDPIMSELNAPSTSMVRITSHGPGGHVAELALDRPEAMNAVSTQMALELGAACAQLSADRNVRAVLITSTSTRAFCVGADLKERGSFT